jgi:hypothetical protein
MEKYLPAFVKVDKMLTFIYLTEIYTSILTRLFYFPLDHSLVIFYDRVFCYLFIYYYYYFL